MIFEATYFEPWGGGAEYRERLKDFDPRAWISPAEALDILQTARATTPMPHKEFLSWRAARGLLPAVAQQIHETSSDSGDQASYEYISLTTEWGLDEWKWEHADLWRNATMRMTRPYAGSILMRDFVAISFRREEVEAIVQGWPAEQVDDVKDHRLVSVEQVPWSVDEMSAAIRACPERNRDKAWRNYFKDRLAEHGWKNASFRALWSNARETAGLKGRPTARA